MRECGSNTLIVMVLVLMVVVVMVVVVVVVAVLVLLLLLLLLLDCESYQCGKLPQQLVLTTTTNVASARAPRS